MRHLIAALVLLTFAYQAQAADEAKKSEGKKKVSYRKTQEVNFDETDIDGQVRSPDGAYLLQKRGVQFMPLYKVNNQYEKDRTTG
jgi:ethanolamine utilization protein EutP (predicted NTPase)